MSEIQFRLLPEGTLVGSIVDDLEFAEVTNDGETYTLFRVVRFTHEALADSAAWTHQANVARVRVPAIGVALIRVVNRQIEESRVTLSTVTD